MMSFAEDSLGLPELHYRDLPEMGAWFIKSKNLASERDCSKDRQTTQLQPLLITNSSIQTAKTLTDHNQRMAVLVFPERQKITCFFNKHFRDDLPFFLFTKKADQ